MGFLGFVVALFGVLAGFAGFSIKPVAYIAFIVACIGVSIGFVATFTNYWKDK